MIQPNIEDRTTKVTIRIDNEAYQELTGEFVHGELSLLMRQIFGCLITIKDKKGMRAIRDFIHGYIDLTLKSEKYHVVNRKGIAYVNESDAQD